MIGKLLRRCRGKICGRLRLRRWRDGTGSWMRSGSGGVAATDEAELLENAGRKVTVVECSPLNLKITTQEDFKMAEALVEMLPREKTLGQMHPFADERFIV